MNLQPGDILLVDWKSAFTRIVAWFQSENPEAIPRWTHAAIIKNARGGIFQAVLAENRNGQIGEYCGSPVMIGRFTGDLADSFTRAFGRVAGIHYGENYPWYRLVPGCSEPGAQDSKQGSGMFRACHSSLLFTGLHCFNDYDGWTRRNWRSCSNTAKTSRSSLKGCGDDDQRFGIRDCQHNDRLACFRGDSDPHQGEYGGVLHVIVAGVSKLYGGEDSVADLRRDVADLKAAIAVITETPNGPGKA